MSVNMWKKLILTMGCGVGIQQSAYADEQQGVTWLTASDQSTTATRLQTTSAKAITLAMYQDNTASIDVASFLQRDQSTEALVRAAMVLKLQQQSTAIIVQKILQHQNEDGGFGHLLGWKSNALDTAWVLLAFKEMNITQQDVIDKALSYLMTQQNSQGAFQVSHLDPYYVTAYALTALTPYLKTHPTYNEYALKTVSYLESSQQTDGTWASEYDQLYLNALLNEALHPYRQADHAARQAFRHSALSQQAANGSWNDDAYTTAIILHSLKVQATPQVNPVQSSIQFQLVDQETQANISGATVSSSDQRLNATSNQDGHVIFQDVAAGVYDFTVQKEGFGSIQFQIQLKQGERSALGKIELTRQEKVSSGLVQGQVKDKTTGKGIDAAVVQLTAGTIAMTTTTNREGNYQLTLAQPASFDLQISAVGYAGITAVGRVNAGGIFTYSPVMVSEQNNLGTVKGQIKDQKGMALSDVSIIKHGVTVGKTDQNGQFVLTQTTAGEFKLRFDKANYQSTQLNVLLTAGDTVNLGIVQLLNTAPNVDDQAPAIPTGKIDVTVMNYKDKMVYKPTIIAHRIDSGITPIQSQSFTPTETQNNTRLIQDLPAGRWEIVAQHPNFQTTSQVVTIKAGETQTIQLRMALALYDLKGTIIDSKSQQAIANANIQIFDQDNNKALYSGKTDANGQFNVQRLQTEKLRLEIDSLLHLHATYYVDKQYMAGTLSSKTTADLENIRLRPLSADTSLPDLTIIGIDSNALHTDQQSLNVSGVLTAKIRNIGNKAVNQSQQIQVLAFSDLNSNRIFDQNEHVLGQSTLSSDLIKQDPVEVSIQIDGQSLFKDAPIGIWVDSDQLIPERNKLNNILLTSDNAEIKPAQEDLNAEVAWTYAGKSYSSPVIAPLEDSNGDGVIGQGDVATIIYRIFGTQFYDALDGKTGQVKFRLPAAPFSYEDIPAIADLDRDGFPEIVIKQGSQLKVYDHQGQLKKQFATPELKNSGWSSDAFHPHIADLDGDGVPEIVVENKIFNYNKGLIADNLASGATQTLADLNNDGYMEIIGAQGISNWQGQLLTNYKNRLRRKIPLTFLAVGDVLGTARPQIIGFVDNKIGIFDPDTGEEKASYAIPGFSGGAPTIADFDGDGTADIGISRTSSYVAIRGDGSLIWSTPIKDESGASGSTTFDFDDDGKRESVFFDEQYLRVYDAATGKERLKIENSSYTAHEYPVVVDADADGHADIILGSFDSGIRMISGKNRDWANTRNIWNQASYHITNINDDLSVPTKEPHSWKTHNTYRSNILINQHASAAADASASYIQVHDQGKLNQVGFAVRVGNAGGLTIKKGLPVSFYRLSPQQQASNQPPTLLGTQLTSKDLPPGTYEDINYLYSGNLIDFGEIIAIANNDGHQQSMPFHESNRQNNTARLNIGANASHSILGITTQLDKTQYSAQDHVEISTEVSNLGSYASQGTVQHQIYDAENHLIATLATYDVALTANQQSSDQHKQTTSWSLIGIYSGSYHIQTNLIQNNRIVASNQNSFVIQSAAIQADGLTETSIGAEKASYPVNGRVVMDMKLMNTSSNDLSAPATVLTEVFDDHEQVIFTRQVQYAQLAANAIKQAQYTLQLSNARAGRYTIRTTTTVGQHTYTRQANFEVLSATQTGLGLIGTLTALPIEVPLGNPAILQFHIQNTGSETWRNLPVRIRLFKNNDVQPFHTLQSSIETLIAGAQTEQSLTVKTQGQIGDHITAALTYIAGSGQEKALAQSHFKLIQPPIKVELPDYALVNNQILVYYSCEPGWYKSVNNWSFGQFNYACFNERGKVLTQYLNELKQNTGINYRLTTQPSEFQRLMRSGQYNNYWVLGAVEKFHPSTNDELRELMFNGSSVLFDQGILSWTNYDLLNAVDIRYRGSLLLSKAEMTTHAPVYDATLPTLHTVGNNAVWYLGSRAKATATYDGKYCRGFEQDWIKAIETSVDVAFYHCQNNKKYPAIVTTTYGDGQPLALSFDLVTSLTAANLHSKAQQHTWKNWLKQSIEYQKIDAKKRLSYAPQEPVYLTTTLTSSQSTSALVVVSLPQDAQWLGSEEVVNRQVQFKVSLDALKANTFTLPILLPKQQGTHAIQVQVFNQTDVTSPPLNRKEYRFLVRGVDERTALLHAAIAQWTVNAQTILPITVIKSRLRIAKQHHQFKRYDRAIALYAEAGGLMDQLPVNQIKAARQELDELIRTVQIQWYQSRP